MKTVVWVLMAVVTIRNTSMGENRHVICYEG